MAGAVCFTAAADGGRFPRPRSSALLGSGGALESACRTAVSAAVVLGVGASFFERLLSMAIGSGGSAFARSAPPSRMESVEWPEKFPYKDEDFQRFEETPDSFFYLEPRFVTHIDDYAIRALTKYYSKVSHFPAGYRQDRIVGMGLNEEELKRNPVSVDYLTKPIEVFREMQRVLKPRGQAIMSFSNRCFWTKATSIWTSTGDADHVWIVGSYFHYAGGFEPPQAVDISPNPGRSEPMYTVYPRKIAA